MTSVILAIGGYVSIAHCEDVSEVKFRELIGKFICKPKHVTGGLVDSSQQKTDFWPCKEVAQKLPDEVAEKIWSSVRLENFKYPPLPPERYDCTSLWAGANSGS